MNLGDHPEYDPAVIGKLKSMRGGTSATKDKEPSKAVQTVKNMASSKSVGFDRDDLSFKKKKNFREWSQQLDDMWNSDWRDELKEGMTTSDTFTYSKAEEVILI